MAMDAPNQRIAKIQAQICDVHPTPSNVSSSPLAGEHFISNIIFNDINSETLLSQEQEHLRFHATEKSKAINDDVRKTHSKSGQSSLLGNVIKENYAAAQGSREHNIDATHHCPHNSTQYRRHRYRRHTISEYIPRQDYKLLFANDFDDSKKCSNSELRISDSTDSMKNYYSGSTTESSQNSEGDYESNDSCPDVCNYSDSLSTSSPTYDEQMKTLHIVELNDSLRKKEEVGLYLLSYSYGSPAFTQNDYSKLPDPNWLLPAPQTMRKTVYYRSSKCICVPNESGPGFTILHSPPPDINIALLHKFKSEELLILLSTLDIRVQKILQAFQENSHIKYKESADLCIEVQKKNFIKVFPPNVKGSSQDEQGSQEIVDVNASETTSEEQISYELAAINNPMNLTKNSSTLVLHLLNVHRAYYDPLSNVPPLEHITYWLKKLKLIARAPPPQYQAISCSSAVAQELLMRKIRCIRIKPVSASKVHMPRNPARCPEHKCQCKILVSNCSKHLVLDRTHLLMENITPFQPERFFLDPRLTYCGITNCIPLYLMHDKITNLGSTSYIDLLPLLIMSSRINRAQMYSMNEHDYQDCIGIAKSTEFFLMWIAGIVPEEFPISVTLTVWPDKTQMPKYHVVYSGEVCSVRKSQQNIEVCKSGRVLSLSSLEMDFLTQGGKQFLYFAACRPLIKRLRTCLACRNCLRS
uniref:DUF4729 domain-containing protein n=1 Tax=Glossina austeni TaxID=7395 RepID=A0A1A9V3Q9_GLOAU